MALPYVTTTQLKKVTDKMDFIKEQLNPVATKTASSNAVSVYKLDLDEVELLTNPGDLIILEDATELHDALVNSTPIVFTNIHYNVEYRYMEFVGIKDALVQFVWNEDWESYTADFLAEMCNGPIFELFNDGDEETPYWILRQIIIGH